MEAIATLSLACNVVQLVAAGIDIIGTTRQIAQQGQTEGNGALADNAQRLSLIVSALETSINTNNGQSTLSSTEAQLVQIAKECNAVARRLSCEIEKLIVASSKNRRDVFSKGLLTWWKKDEIDKLKSKLQEYERTLNSGILVALKQDNTANAAIHAAQFDTLHASLQDFIQSVNDGSLNCADLIRDESATLKGLLEYNRQFLTNHMEDTARGLQNNLSHKEQQRIFLSSLTFPEMNARFNQICKEGDGTFQWIFKEGAGQSWSDFSTWLANGEDIYWIQGKAGSGKSTLMRFILHNEQTRQQLRTWACHDDVVCLRFGIWQAGVSLQRSIHGLLCSLLHQTICGQEAIVQKLLQSSSDLSQKVNVNDWSRAELIATLATALQQRTDQTSCCIFLDGLDELNEIDDQSALLSILTSLCSSKKVKFCVSSRPDPFWMLSLQNYPQLRLQDLTRKDIEAYVTMRFERMFVNHHTSIAKEDQQVLTYQIVSKASGVFLWAHVVMNSLQRGLTSSALLQELELRIQQLPSDIDELYQTMFSRVSKDWQIVQQEAALYFRLCILGLGISARTRSFPPWESRLSHFAVCEQEWRDQQHNSMFNGNTTRFHQACDRVRKRIPIVCFGLLEVIDNSGRPYPFKEVVRFSHRTALEWLLDTTSGREILSQARHTSDMLYSGIFHAEMMRYEIDKNYLTLDQWWNGVHELISLLWEFHTFKEPVSVDTSFKLLRALEIMLSDSQPVAEQGGRRPHLALHAKLSASRAYQYQMHDERSGVSPAVKSNLAFDVLGLSLSFGIYSLLENPTSSDQHYTYVIEQMTNEYKSYLLLCILEGLEFLLDRRYYDGTRISRASDPTMLFTLFEKILSSGIDVSSIAAIPRRGMETAHNPMCLVFCIKEASIATASGRWHLSEYVELAEGKPNHLGSCAWTAAILWNDNHYLFDRNDSFDVYVAIGAEDYVRFLKGRFKQKVAVITNNAGLTGNNKLDINLANSQVVCIKHASEWDPYDRAPSLEASEEMIAWLTPIPIAGDEVPDRSSTAQEEHSYFWNFRNRIERCMDSKGYSSVDTKAHLKDLGYSRDELVGTRWKKQIPMFKSEMKAKPDATTESDHKDSETELSDDDSFKSLD